MAKPGAVARMVYEPGRRDAMAKSPEVVVAVWMTTPTAESDDNVIFANGAVLHRFGQGDGYRGRRRIAILGDVDDALAGRHAQHLHCRIDDAQIRLMRNDEIDVVGSETRVCQRSSS